MGSLPLALSIHHFISSVGADAGFASIIGLAILVLLYFSQARETSTLREHAYEAAERIEQLEARVAQLSRGGQQPPPQAPAAAAAGARAAAAPSRARAAAVAPPPATAFAPASGSAPVAPAGVAAPALTAATRLIPSPEPAGAVALAPRSAGGTTTVSPPPEDVSGPAPSTVAGAANGAGRDAVAAPRPVSAPPASPPPRGQGRLGAPAPSGRRPGPPPRSRPPQGGGQGPNRVLIAIAGVVLLAVVVVVLVIVTSGGGSGSKSAASSANTTNSPATKRAHKAAFNPSSVTVAVLNGTATNGLAKRVSLELSAKGYKPGTVATASDQTHTTTVVGYLSGFRRDAVAVAGSLKIGGSAVGPVDQASQAVACPPPASCPANVIVTVGADLANSQ